MTSEKRDERIAALEKRLAELEGALPRPLPKGSGDYRPRDPTAGFGMPAAAMREMVAASPEGLMADIRGDAGRAERGRLPLVSGAAPRGSGWVSPGRMEVAGGKQTQELVERLANAALPHGPMHGKTEE